jgi:nitrite reductase (NO-forming)
MTNLLGWVGLTVLGTLVTLWPTMLRTRMSELAEADSRRALPLAVAGLALVVAGPLGDLPWVSVAGIATYLAGLALIGRGVLVAARRRSPTTFPTLSAGAGIAWLAVGLVLLASMVVGTTVAGGGWHDIADRYGSLTAIFVVGFALQVMLGALTHLIPVVLGGGPSVLRAAMQPLERWGVARVVIANVGLAVCLLPVPSLVRVVVSALVLIALASYLPLMLLGIRAAVRARRQLAGAPAGTVAPARAAPLVRTPLSHPQVVAGIAVIALGVSVGVGLDPAAAGLSTGSRTAPQAAAVVTPTGLTTRVTVTAADMRLTPATIDVPLGNHLVIDLVNADPTDVHDLVLETGQASGRLGPGERATVDAGVVAGDVAGWCSVVGHRQMGMTLSIKAVGAPTTSADANAPIGTQVHDSMGMPATGSSSAAQPKPDVGQLPGPGWAAYDPVLPPLTAERTHHVTLTVEEVVLEVAPGVWQKRWTYNGQVPGPTLHGRVGDTFVVTLVNHANMGHSVDFHAGENAPDQMMRTIPPGASLTYTFTARHAGVWMYHCSSMPMSTHIAAGMFGAVVIEPPGLPGVDRSYLLVQSEIHLGPGPWTRAAAGPVDSDSVAAETPDAMAFNGQANQYAHEPLTARAGERVRFWLLDAGPSRAESFHVVGAQFDTVWKEGAYLLGGPGIRGTDAAGGSQALDLLAAQGGFVETTFAQPGSYPFVTHIMVDAERGARGVVRVAP